MLRNFIILSSVVSLTALASSAYAQTADAGNATAAETGSANEIGEIIVTAQRRSERLQDVPIAVTAANASALAEARVDNVTNVGAVSPSISFRTQNIASSSSNLVIRGLGTSGSSRSFEGSVGVFIDGAYRSRSAVAMQDFLDFDSLQVVRGPQGTLFGKNTTAGALLLTSTTPSTDGIEGTIDANVGNFNTYSLRAAVNLPLGSNLALRVAGIGSGFEGFYTDVNTRAHVNGSTTRSGKAQLLWEPSSSATVRLIGDYSSSKGDCCYAAARTIAGPTAPVIDAFTRALGLKLPSSDPESFEVALNGHGGQSVKDYGATLLVDLDLGAGSLKSVTAYRRYDVVQKDADADFSGADLIPWNEYFHSKFISQEFTYNTEVPSLNADAVFGVFVSDERLRIGKSQYNGTQMQSYLDTLFSFLPAGTLGGAPGLALTTVQHGKNQSYAVFAHSDFNVTDKFTIIAGVRYSIERKRGAASYVYLDPNPFNFNTLLGLAPSPEFDVTHTDRAISGTFGLRYKFTPNAMIYATYNRGFKAGGVNLETSGAGTLLNNPTAFAALPLAVQGLVNAFSGGAPVTSPLDPSYKPETVNAFEVGAKLQYLDNRARTNFSVFYYDLKNLQIAQFVGLQFTVLNSKSAVDYGAEIENTFQLTDALTLNADATWVPHAKYGNDPRIGVLSNGRFRFAPKLSANVGIKLDTPLTDQLNLLARLQYQYKSSESLNTAGNDTQKSVGLLNANLGVKIKDNVTIEAWAQNLTNEIYVTSVANTPFQSGTKSGYLGAPRTFGVRLHGSF